MQRRRRSRQHCPTLPLHCRQHSSADEGAGEMKHPSPLRRGFCIYINTFCQGPVPVERDETNFPVVYATLFEAQREIADFTIERIQQFLAGERDYDDAITVEDYVVEVDVF